MTTEPPFPLYDALTGALTAPGFRWLATLSPAEQVEFLHDHENVAAKAISNLAPGADWSTIRKAFVSNEHALAEQNCRTMGDRPAPNKPGWFWLGGDHVVFYLVMVTQRSAIVAPVVWDIEESVIAANQHDYIVPDVPTKGANTAILLSLGREVPLENLARLHPIGPLHLPWNLELHTAYAKLHGKSLSEFNSDNMGDEDCWQGVEPRFIARKLADARMAALQSGSEFSSDTLDEVYARRDRKRALQAGPEAPVFQFMYQTEAKHYALAAADGQPANVSVSERIKARFTQPEIFSVVVELDVPTGFARQAVVKSAWPLMFRLSATKQDPSDEFFRPVRFIDDYSPCLKAAESQAMQSMLQLPRQPLQPYPLLLGNPQSPIEGRSAGLAMALAAFAGLMPVQVIPKWVAALGVVDESGKVGPVDKLSEKLQLSRDFLAYVASQSALVLVAPGAAKDFAPSPGLEIREVATLEQAVRAVWGDAKLAQIYANGPIDSVIKDLEERSDSKRVLELSQPVLQRVERDLPAEPQYRNLIRLWRVHGLRLKCFDHLAMLDEAVAAKSAAFEVLARLAVLLDRQGRSLFAKLPHDEAKAIIDLLAHSLQSLHCDQFDFDSNDAQEILRLLSEGEHENLPDDVMLRVDGARMSYHRYRYRMDPKTGEASLAELRRLVPRYESAYRRDGSEKEFSYFYSHQLENDIVTLPAAELHQALVHFQAFYAKAIQAERRGYAAFCLLHGGVLGRELAFAGIRLAVETRAQLLVLLERAEGEPHALAIGELGLLIADYLAGEIIKDEFDLRVADCMRSLLNWAQPEGVALIAPALAGKSALLVAKALMLKAKSLDAESLSAVRAGLGLLQRLTETAHSKPFFEADCTTLEALTQLGESARLDELVAVIDRLSGKIRF